MMLSTAREQGAGMAVIYALQRLAFPEVVAGLWAEVRADAEEALSLARSLGHQTLAATPLAWLTLLGALQGRADYDDVARGARGGDGVRAARHPGGPRARPDPVGEGIRAAPPATRRPPYITLARCDSRR